MCKRLRHVLVYWYLLPETDTGYGKLTFISNRNTLRTMKTHSAILIWLDVFMLKMRYLTFYAFLCLCYGRRQLKEILFDCEDKVCYIPGEVFQQNAVYRPRTVFKNAEVVQIIQFDETCFLDLQNLPKVNNIQIQYSTFNNATDACLHMRNSQTETLKVATEATSAVCRKLSSLVSQVNSPAN